MGKARQQGSSKTRQHIARQWHPASAAAKPRGVERERERVRVCVCVCGERGGRGLLPYHWAEAANNATGMGEPCQWPWPNHQRRQRGRCTAGLPGPAIESEAAVCTAETAVNSMGLQRGAASTSGATKAALASKPLARPVTCVDCGPEVAGACCRGQVAT